MAIISAAAAVVVPAISFYLTKKKEREADWQKYKLEQYREFVAALSGIVGTDSTDEGNRCFALACNNLHRLAPKPVITALHEFRNEISVSNLNKSRGTHDLLLSRLILEIRRDVKIPGTPEAGELVVGLWCSGAADSTKSKATIC